MKVAGLGSNGNGEQQKRDKKNNVPNKAKKIKHDTHIPLNSPLLAWLYARRLQAEMFKSKESSIAHACPGHWT